jgi:alcohol dehydrogenase
VYHGPGERGWDSVPDPTITAPPDIIVRIDTSTICGTDLHILKGDVERRGAAAQPAREMITA